MYVTAYCLAHSRSLSPPRGLAFTRYCFPSKLHVGVHHPCIPPLHLQSPPLLQYYCTTIGQHALLPPTLLYAVNHTILVMAISCQGQRAARSSCCQSRCRFFYSQQPNKPVIVVHSRSCASSSRVRARICSRQCRMCICSSNIDILTPTAEGQCRA